MRQKANGLQLDTVAKRARLAPDRNPYWTSLSGRKGGLTLGYRKLSRGPGSWVAKAVIANNRFEQTFAAADDRGSDEAALSFSKAVSWCLDWARQKSAAVDDEAVAGVVAPTVYSVCSVYIDGRAKRKSPPKSGLKKHLKKDSKFAETRLSKLTLSDIEIWRDGVVAAVPTVSTANRCLSDLRAALNKASDDHHSTLPSRFREIVRLGCKHMPTATNPRKQILPDKTIQLLVDKSFDVDQDLGELAMTEAATGARYSQISRLRVEDLQMSGPRLMMPVSSKGRGEKSIQHIPTVIGQDVADVLFASTAGRSPGEPLLMRWNMVQIENGSWIRGERVPWRPNVYARQWKEVLKRAGVAPTIVMYAFRHSSIVRALRAGLPIRLVAAMHDTSAAQIEKFYSAYITEITEDLARRAIVPLVPRLKAHAA